MSGLQNCETWDECNATKNLSLEQLLRLMITVDANGCPVWRGTEGAPGGDGAILAQIENNQTSGFQLSGLYDPNTGNTAGVDNLSGTFAIQAAIYNSSGVQISSFFQPFSVNSGVIDANTTRVVLASNHGDIGIKSPSGTSTPTSSVETNSTNSPVAAGFISVTFTTSSTFAGTINGIARSPSTSYVFAHPLGKPLASIAYTVTSGSLTIDTLT